MEYDLHTILDILTLVTTLWVIFTIRTKLRPTYNAEADSLGHLYVVRALYMYLLDEKIRVSVIKY